jgi:2-methylisocitrate lyase-like PEP mutase family enzyme
VRRGALKRLANKVRGRGVRAEGGRCPETAKRPAYHHAFITCTPMTRALHNLFKTLHSTTEPLIIPNAWDAASGALFAQAGAPAIATSSASLAWSLGYADGGTLPLRELLAAIARIQRVLQIPLTVDLEDGYSEEPKAVAALVAEIAALGVVGINLEDGAHAPILLAEKIAAARNALGATPLFINARTDVYLSGLATSEGAAAMTLERAKLYEAAGADGLFVPGMGSMQDTARITSATTLPLNLMLLPNMPTIQDLFAAGARRFTAGPANFQAAYGHAQRLAKVLMADQDAAGLFANATPYDAMNALFKKP